MTVMGRLRLLLWLLPASSAIAAGATPPKDAAVGKLLRALRPVPELRRQQNIGAVLREFKAQGLIPFRPSMRIDYTDYYPVQKSVLLFGHDLVVLEEEYMTKYVGCCVSEGGGALVRLKGAINELEAFAKANLCSVREYESLEKYQKESHVSFALPPGRYAELSCRARDEDK
ncbi:hypothetical protein [Kinneretia aquatilis]|uniref:hypothetical protein n=1 Tax=Kinneretia aquatilis TaxID=2070761 RepID=UPI002557FFB1|nr:hypothetical protein [Paucibacter aquatile]WIV98462.1 hypothetical protein K9V56_002825 [Paucibacter aquatile]WIV99626.1 hypothetical protein K9V56_009195 [Paucibacter aquatile]